MRLLLIVLLLGLTACNSAWDKDPFKDDSDNVKNGVPQGTKEKKTPPLQSVVFIKLEPFYELKEGKKLVIETGYTITHPEFRFVDFVIHDLEENFPGAIYDAKTKEITWTPGEDYVPSGAIVFRNPLTISVFVEYEGLTHEIRKSSSINVLRGDARAPYIKDVIGLDDLKLKEGSFADFKVVVEDEVSPNGPTLAIRNSSWGTTLNGASYITYDVRPVQDKKEPSLWTFKGTVDLRDLTEVTPDSQNYTVAFTAYSAFGEASQAWSETFKILTNLLQPTFFKNNKQVFNKGVLNTYTFTIADSKKEGVVEGLFVTDCSREPVAGADCSCTRNNYFSTCTINWVPQNTGTFEFEIKGTNSIDTSDITDSKDKTEKIKIEVI